MRYCSPEVVKSSTRDAEGSSSSDTVRPSRPGTVRFSSTDTVASSSCHQPILKLWDLFLEL